MLISAMGRALRMLGGGAVFVMLRESEVGYQMVRDPSDQTGQTILGPAIGEQKIVFEATSYREICVDAVDGHEQGDLWEFVMMTTEQSPGGPVRQRSLLYIEGKDILFVRAPSALAG